MFENSKNLSNEKETQKFILRQEKARNEEVKKKARFENLGRVKGNTKPYNLSDNIPTQIVKKIYIIIERRRITNKSHRRDCENSSKRASRNKP